MVSKEVIYQYLEAVKDPEIPVISIKDLGVLHDVGVQGDRVVIEIIPTYSGCPAMSVIQEDIHAELAKYGLFNVEIQLLNEPVWTTDMISEKGKSAMMAYGIAPPVKNEKAIVCPQCGSSETTCISQFGSTACKALYKCEACLEPFDYFKCHA